MGVPRHRHLLAPGARADGSRPTDRGPDRGDPLLRLPGRRRTPGDDHRAHRRRLRRPHGLAHQGRRLPARRRPGRGRPGRGPRERPRDRGARPGRRQRRRCLDQRGAGDARRPRRPRCRGEQGHPPRRTPRPDPQRVRLHHPHRDVGAVRDPVGPSLDHRHHRHTVGPRPRPSGGVTSRHRVRARARQQDAAHAPRPHRRRRRVRRTPTATARRHRADLEDLARAHRGLARTRAGDDRRRQAHHLPRDGAGRGRRRRGRSSKTGPDPPSPTGFRCSAPPASRRAPTSGSSLARSSGLDIGRIDHLLGRYGGLIDEVLGLVGDRPELGQPLAGRRGLPRRRGRLRRHPRGRPPPRRRAHPPHPPVHRDLRPRYRRRPPRRRADGRRARLGRRAASRRRSTTTCAASRPSDRASRCRPTRRPTRPASRRPRVPGPAELNPPTRSRPSDYPVGAGKPARALECTRGKVGA